MTVAIVDYGSGNLHSAAKAFERAARELGSDQPILVTDDPETVRQWIERGVDWIATGTDTGSLLAGGRRALEQARAFRAGSVPRAGGAA